MEITFQYTGQLANIVGSSEELLDVEQGAQLKTVVDQLAKRHSADYADLVFDTTGNLRPSLLVVLDGEQLDGDKAHATLDDVKNVMLMTPIAGG